MPASVEKETPLHEKAFCTTPDGDIFSLRICSTLCSLSATFKVRYVCRRLAYLEISLSDVFATNNDFASGPDFVMDGVVA